jgi:AmiR/NasT family two-component response regulator
MVDIKLSIYNQGTTVVMLIQKPNMVRMKWIIDDGFPATITLPLSHVTVIGGHFNFFAVR